MKEHKLAGELRLSRTTSTHEDDYISIELQDETSRVRVLTIAMPLDQLANLLTSREAACRFELGRIEVVGKVRETKPFRERITLNDDEWKAWSSSRDYSGIVAKLQHLAVDGWQVPTYFGQQGAVTFVGDTYRRKTYDVRGHLFRYIEKPQWPPHE